MRFFRTLISDASTIREVRRLSTSQRHVTPSQTCSVLGKCSFSRVYVAIKNSRLFDRSYTAFSQQQEQTGPGINIKIKLTLEELYEGKSFDISYNRKIICPHCRGSGGDNPEDVKTCTKCNGQGVTIVKQQIAPGFVQQFQ